jgi:hypothetical protein
MADQPAPLPPLEPLEPLERKRSADALEAPSKAQRGPAETLAARLRALGLGPGVDDACARVLKTPHESIIEDWRNTSLGLFDPTSTVTVDFVDDEPTLRVGGDPTEQAAMRLAIAGTAGYDGSLGSLIVEAAEGDGEPKAGLGSTAEPLGADAFTGLPAVGGVLGQILLATVPHSGDFFDYLSDMVERPVIEVLKNAPGAAAVPARVRTAASRIPANPGDPSGWGAVAALAWEYAEDSPDYEDLDFFKTTAWAMAPVAAWRANALRAALRPALGDAVDAITAEHCESL